MHTSKGRAIPAIAGLTLLIVLVTAGCGHRAQPADTAGSGTPAGTSAAVVQPSAMPVASAPVTPVSATPATPATTATQAPSVAPDAAPVPTPDLTGVESLLTEIAQNLDADASAGTSEGSPK